MASLKRRRYDGPPDYLRPEDCLYMFQLGEQQAIELAKQCGAHRKVGKSVLINREIMKDFIETFNVS